MNHCDMNKNIFIGIGPDINEYVPLCRLACNATFFLITADQVRGRSGNHIFVLNTNQLCYTIYILTVSGIATLVKLNIG